MSSLATLNSAKFCLLQTFSSPACHQHMHFPNVHQFFYIQKPKLRMNRIPCKLSQWMAACRRHSALVWVTQPIGIAVGPLLVPSCSSLPQISDSDIEPYNTHFKINSIQASLHILPTLLVVVIGDGGCLAAPRSSVSRPDVH